MEPRFHLEKCTSELDISIIDRLSSLIHSKIYYYTHSSLHSSKFKVCLLLSESFTVTAEDDFKSIYLCFYVVRPWI